jgi:hypothetical protein
MHMVYVSMRPHRGHVLDNVLGIAPSAPCATIISSIRPIDGRGATVASEEIYGTLLMWLKMWPLSAVGKAAAVLHQPMPAGKVRVQAMRGSSCIVTLCAAAVSAQTDS